MRSAISSAAGAVNSNEVTFASQNGAYMPAIAAASSRVAIRIVAFIATRGYLLKSDLDRASKGRNLTSSCPSRPAWHVACGTLFREVVMPRGDKSKYTDKE